MSPSKVETDPATELGLPRTRRVHFVIRYHDKWRPLIDDPDTIPDALHDQHWKVISNEDMTTVQTFVNLRRRGLDVRAVDHFVPGEINVVSGLDFAASDRTWDSFVVAVRGDGFRPALADVVMAHNTRVMRAEDLWIPLWLQTGLLPRDPARGNRLENVEFKGDEINLHDWFKTDEFLASLDELGVTFRVGGLDHTEANRWNDYRSTDLILAARDLPIGDSDVKPGLKLVNAWGAGTPALLGPEAGYRQLRRSPLDYIEVVSPEQVIESIALLKAQPELYGAMVANGLRRAEAFSDDATALRWATLLAGPITERFESWRTRPDVRRRSDFARRVVEHKYEMRAAAHRRTHGPRLLTGDPSEPIVPFDDPTYGLVGSDRN